jgi:hypothetical protein
MSQNAQPSSRAELIGIITNGRNVCFNERRPAMLAGELVELLARLVVEAHERDGGTLRGADGDGDAAPPDGGLRPPHA